MKQIIQRLGTTIAMLWISLSAFAYDFEVDGIYYNITSMADLEVEVTSPTSNYEGDIIVPPYVNNNNRTFTVTSIGDRAFNPSRNGGSNERLTSVTLPNTIRKIGVRSFYNCPNIKSINLLEGLIEISESAFSKTGICSLVIPESVTTIGSWAFSGCQKLLEVFCTSRICPSGLTISTFEYGHPSVEIYVPSIGAYGFGREYLSFPTFSFDYTGQSHIIEWTNNLKAYKCEISESECQTDVNAGQYAKNLKAIYSNGVDFSVEIPYGYTINKAPMTLSVNDVKREYGELNPSFTCNITGFVNGENEHSLGITPAFECEATRISKVGNYRILASLNAPNYEITYKYGTLTIEKAPLTVTVLNADKIYGNENPEFLFSYMGLKNNETTPEWNVTPKFFTSATVASGVGQYSISASNGMAVNYNVTKYNPGILTISKRDLTAKANDCERLYGEENPQFGISYIGFVNGDSETSLVQKPVAECNATKTSNTGTYHIVVAGGNAENYRFVYRDGSLKINPLTIGFKDVYNSVTYNDMSLSTSDTYFNYIPNIVGPFSEDDFWIELWFLDKDNKYNQHVATINGGDYAGNYVNTNSDRIMWAGKYIFNLTSKGTNPNVVANPSRAYLTVNKTSNNLEWDADSPIYVKVGEKVDLGITYQADLWCTFNTDYNEELIGLSSEGETGNNPHWFATGLKEGETTLYFGIECEKNDMGFYDFTDSKTLSKRIVVEPSAGINGVVDDDNSIRIITNEGYIHILNKNPEAIVRVYTIHGIMIAETIEEMICSLSSGLYIVTVGSKSFKVSVR